MLTRASTLDAGHTNALRPIYLVAAAIFAIVGNEDSVDILSAVVVVELVHGGLGESVGRGSVADRGSVKGLGDCCVGREGEGNNCLGDMHRG